MIFSYEHFISKLNARIKNDDAFIYELLITVVKNPNRYTGIFRLSNAKTKLIQNATQSREIKFGDFMEEIITEYISAIGYTNLCKDIGTDEEGNALSADQVFIKGDTVYLVEQKIRDDHDSTKKRGQFQNFKKKYLLLRQVYPHHKINASMWFVDDSLAKNKNYYRDEAALETDPAITLNIVYGGVLFDLLFDRRDVWEELCNYLQRNKRERGDEVLFIPDFDTSPEFLIALRRLRANEPTLYRKLLSNNPKYIHLRNELFPTGENLRMV